MRPIVLKAVGGVATAIFGGVVALVGAQMSTEATRDATAEAKRATDTDYIERIVRAEINGNRFIEQLGEIDNRLKALERRADAPAVGDEEKARLDAIEKELSDLRRAGTGPAAVDLDTLAALLARDHADILRGPAGVQGPQGPQGLPGPAGPQGQTGASAAALPQAVPSAGAAQAAGGALIAANSCLDIAGKPSMPAVTFQDGAMICEGATPLAVLRNRSSLPGRVDFSPIGGRALVLGPSEQAKIGDGGRIFFLISADRDAGTLIGGIR